MGEGVEQEEGPLVLGALSQELAGLLDEPLRQPVQLDGLLHHLVLPKDHGVGHPVHPRRHLKGAQRVFACSFIELKLHWSLIS